MDDEKVQRHGKACFLLLADHIYTLKIPIKLLKKRMQAHVRSFFYNGCDGLFRKSGGCSENPGLDKLSRCSSKLF